jgi:hypothetical protein
MASFNGSRMPPFDLFIQAAYQKPTISSLLQNIFDVLKTRNSHGHQMALL